MGDSLIKAECDNDFGFESNARSLTLYIVPEISRFYGIIIRMFSEPVERHHVPHFHAYYQENMAVFSISPVALITGMLPQPSAAVDGSLG